MSLQQAESCAIQSESEESLTSLVAELKGLTLTDEQRAVIKKLEDTVFRLSGQPTRCQSAGPCNPQTTPTPFKYQWTIS